MKERMRDDKLLYVPPTTTLDGSLIPRHQKKRKSTHASDPFCCGKNPIPAAHLRLGTLHRRYCILPFWTPLKRVSFVTIIRSFWLISLLFFPHHSRRTWTLIQSYKCRLLPLPSLPPSPPKKKWGGGVRKAKTA